MKTQDNFMNNLIENLGDLTLNASHANSWHLDTQWHKTRLYGPHYKSLATPGPPAYCRDTVPI